ncbi:hypothetical protein DSM110277_01268 [Sulfitobacter pontiacus]|uniref:Trypsin-like peptidase domain-containing protein n=1 Tax=Sulfitobacter pontiacus TaxID=60137 RepID=A0AAX3A9C1_9RHOB|nr:hypothetical protein [Sulfitobacter pontiacus]UOA22860.1 hypothetical protein DSM110277_01268 [Sulfitobacter pontiacus]
MRDMKTIIGSRIDTSIDTGSLLVPINSLSHYIQRFSDPGLYHAHGLKEYQLSKSGSLARVAHKGRYFALTSHHQSKLADYDYDELVVTNRERSRYYSGHRAVFPIEVGENEYSFDCLVYEFTDLVRSGRIPSDVWYQIPEESRGYSTPKPIIICTVGYPSYRNHIDYESSSYPIGPNAVWGFEKEPRIVGRLSFSPISPIDFEPSGMSGSPVFAVRMEGTLLKLFLAGILTEASRTAFNFLPLNRIIPALNSIA